MKYQKQGFLFAITKNGTTSHLYGTMHVGKKEWELSEEVLNALRQSDVLAPEVNTQTHEVELAYTKHVLALSEVDTSGFRAATTTPRREAYLDACWAQVGGRPEEVPAGVPMSVELSLFAAYAVHKAGLKPPHGSEFKLFERAEVMGLPIVDLENIELQLSLMAAPVLHEEGRLMDEIMTLSPKEYLTMTTGVFTAFEEGSLEALTEVIERCAHGAGELTRAKFDQVFTARNLSLACKVRAWHEEGQRVFAAIGCGHLVGSTGMLGLLAEQGFDIERI